MTNQNEHSHSETNHENHRFSHHNYGGGFRQGRSGLDWATSPGFHPGKLAAVVLGTALFPPLGLAALGYFLWNSRRYANADGPTPFAQGGRCGHRGMGGRMGRRGMRSSGNSAMDEHTSKVLNELRETRHEFAEHRAAAKAKRDAEAFAQFQAARETKSNSETGSA